MEMQYCIQLRTLKLVPLKSAMKQAAAAGDVWTGAHCSGRIMRAGARSDTVILSATGTLSAAAAGDYKCKP